MKGEERKEREREKEKTGERNRTWREGRRKSLKRIDEEKGRGNTM